MDTVIANTTTQETEKVLRSFRNALLIDRQCGTAVDLEIHFCAVHRLLECLTSDDENKLRSALIEIEERSGCLSPVSSAGIDQTIVELLDLISKAEAETVNLSFSRQESNIDLAAFLDSSFTEIGLCSSGSEAKSSGSIDSRRDYDPDTEMLEVFSIEAEELLTAIESQMQVLVAEPMNKAAVWEMRRSAHTFKGAAGAVGLKQPLKLSHRLEDVLTFLADDKVEVSEKIAAVLTRAADCLRRSVNGPAPELEALIAGVERDLDAISNGALDDAGPGHATIDANISSHLKNAPPARRPIVRVSVDRLDEIAHLARELIMRQAVAEQAFADLNKCLLHLRPPSDWPNSAAKADGSKNSHAAVGANAGVFAAIESTSQKLSSEFSNQRRAAEQVSKGITEIRLIKFGSIFTRLQRAVGATCEEERKKVDLVFEDPDTELDTDIIDSMVEPIMHLMRNAVVHGIETPEIRRLLGKPETGLISVGVSAKSDVIEIRITDDGQGIEAAALRRKAGEMGMGHEFSGTGVGDGGLLDLMCLRGLTTAGKLTVNAGRGVGMSIVRESVEARNGTLGVEMQPHHGTTFTIKVPNLFSFDEVRSTVVPRTNSTLAIEDNTSSSKTNALVLIADDSPSIRHLVASVVRKAGFELVIARDGREALDIVNRERKPDLVLTDVEMPRMDGHALAAAIRAATPTIPIAFITSRSGHNDLETALRLGVTSVVSKPFTEKDILQLLDQYL